MPEEQQVKLVQSCQRVYSTATKNAVRPGARALQCAQGFHLWHALRSVPSMDDTEKSVRDVAEFGDIFRRQPPLDSKAHLYPDVSSTCFLQVVSQEYHGLPGYQSIMPIQMSLLHIYKPMAPILHSSPNTRLPIKLREAVTLPPGEWMMFW